MESRKRPLADDAELTAHPKKRVVTSPGVGTSPVSVANGTPDAVPEPTGDEQLEVGTPRVDLSFVVTLPLSFFFYLFFYGYIALSQGCFVPSDAPLCAREREKPGAHRTTRAAQEYV